MDAHSRDRNMLPSATALGASMLQATCFLVYKEPVYKKRIYRILIIERLTFDVGSGNL